MSHKILFVGIISSLLLQSLGAPEKAVKEFRYGWVIAPEDVNASRQLGSPEWLEYLRADLHQALRKEFGDHELQDGEHGIRKVRSSDSIGGWILDFLNMVLEAMANAFAARAMGPDSICEAAFGELYPM